MPTEFPLRRTCPFGPPPEYARLRAEAPATRVRLPAGAESWLVTRYAEVRALFTDERVSADSTRPGFPILRAAGPPEPGAAPPPRIENRLDELDPPGHTRFRRMLIPEFTLRRVQGLIPGIESVVEGVIDALLAQGPPADLVAAFALPVPSLVICGLLGVPYADRGFFQAKSALAFGLDTPEQQGRAAFAEIAGYLDGLVAAQEAEPGDALIGRLVTAHGRSGALSRAEIVGLVFQLLIAGHETTASMLALGAQTLAGRADLPALVADPARMSFAVEELLRYHSIADFAPRRVAKADVELDGRVIRAGEGLVLSLAGANHDERVFARPDEFDPGRGARHHVAFGFGVHQCVAQNLARAELVIALRELFRRIPALRPAKPAADLPFKYDSVLFGLHELPVVW